ELKFFYPTDTLVTSFDILFFWVARMIMMGLKFMKEIPFKDVYIHALVRDAEGQKMSKSKGNVIDPLGIMDKYGTDALRFTLTAMASPGRDIKLSEQRIEGYRNFTNKIWNAARFVLMNLNDKPLDEKIGDLSLADRWIRVRLRECINSVTKNLDAYRFDEAANQLYQFIWHEYCDWYLELIKPRLSASSPETAATRATMVNTLETLLRLLHPFMPFITEEIWQKIPHQGETIVLASYPKAESISLEDQACEGIMEEIISIIKEIRTIRSELNVPSTQRLKAGLKTTTEDYAQTILRSGGEDIRRMAGLSEFTASLSITKPADALITTTKTGELFVEGVDLKKALPRVEKKLAEASAEFELANQKFRDRAFQEKAPTEVKIQNDLRRNELGKEVSTLSKLRDQIKQVVGDLSS
ncbi:MAG: class I tRNA ligase family protein, partial [Nitrospira sp.]|nr:class I tRNA ligase family protein [Nitrospira sp.]